MHRSEYIGPRYVDEETSRDLHRAYYAQYARLPGVKELVLRGIGLSPLVKSKDRAFNDIPLPRWDALMHGLPHSVVTLLKSNGDYLSLGTAVCILKEAARQLVEAEVEGG